MLEKFDTVPDKIVSEISSGYLRSVFKSRRCRIYFSSFTNGEMEVFDVIYSHFSEIDDMPTTLGKN